MKVLLQKVTQASVTVDDQIVGSIGSGYLLFLGVVDGDTEEQGQWLAEKITKLRLFVGADQKMNDRSLLDVAGDILVISQFTLAADLSKGSRPDFTAAADPTVAEPLYEAFVDQLQTLGVQRVETGKFGAMMAVSLVNDGPCTLLLEK